MRVDGAIATDGLHERCTNAAFPSCRSASALATVPPWYTVVQSGDEGSALRGGVIVRARLCVWFPTDREVDVKSTLSEGPSIAFKLA